ncbi:MAG: hypothetical protein AB7J13_01960 [Pyrinomonadaceae bacterium]
MFKVLIVALVALLVLVPTVTTAQYRSVSATAPSPVVMPVSEVREGMTGTARTVFRGSKSEEFNVEILGVIPNWIGPKQDLIVGKLSGANAERTFVFAGMSGSPVYINGKLVGAISYSFPFAKEPICGITPFEQMTSVVEKGPAVKMASVGARTFSYSELLANAWQPILNSTQRTAHASGFAADSRLMAVAGQTFAPISTPVTFSGISQQTIDLFAPQFRKAGMLPVAAAGGGSAIAEMKPSNEKTLLGGDSVVVHLARGDIQIAAAGTVTHRDGSKIYAFGHPFFGLGSADLPMSESHVVTVVPNANNSFKLAVPDATVGTMTQDRATGIYGLLDQKPRMLPVKIRMITSRGRMEEINFESAFDSQLTPLIISAGVNNALSANERGIGESTIEMTGEITIKGHDPIRLDRRFAGPQAVAFASGVPAVPIGALLRADFEGLDITGITLNMAVIDGSKTATLDRIAVDQAQVRAGETVNVQVVHRTESGRMIVQSVPLKIPAGTAAGDLTITVGDGVSVQKDSAITQFVAGSARELISTLNNLKRPDRIYAVLSRTSTGVVVGSSELPNLPPSMLATLNNERTAGGSKTVVNTIVSETEIAPGEFLVSGSQSLSIEVIR